MPLHRSQIAAHGPYHDVLRFPNEEFYGGGLHQDSSLNNTIPISMLQELRELRNTQFEKIHKSIHDAIMAGELIQNEERKEKLAAKLQKEQEETKGKGRAVEDKLEGLGQKCADSDIASKGETKPYSSQSRFYAAPMSFELPEDAEINCYMLKLLPVPPEFNISR
ncbi:hypothetical protein RUND412_000783, partial [Rhizina undulata]